MLRDPVLLLALAGLLLLEPAPAGRLAQTSEPDPNSSEFTFVVDDTADAPDAAPGDGVCATLAGRCSLRAAVMEANAWPVPSAITMPASGYGLRWTGPGEDAAASGDLDVAGDLSIVGAGPGLTIIQATGDDRAFDILPGASLTVSGARIRKGEIKIASGGGLRNHGSLTLIDVIVSSNRVATGSGSAIFSAAGSVTKLVNTTIWHNLSKSEGGGIYNDGGRLELTNATFSTNDALVAGGGIFNNGGIVVAINSTFSGNKAPPGTGGGIANAAGLVLLKNTIIAHTGSGGDCSGTIISLGHNLIQDPSGCVIEGETRGNLIGVMPKRGGLIEVGREAGSYGLKAGSPAIDAGTNDECPLTDRRGVARPYDGDGDGIAVCDIGADEWRPDSPPVRR